MVWWNYVGSSRFQVWKRIWSKLKIELDRKERECEFWAEWTRTLEENSFNSDFERRKLGWKCQIGIVFGRFISSLNKSVGTWIFQKCAKMAKKQLYFMIRSRLFGRFVRSVGRGAVLFGLLGVGAFYYDTGNKPYWAWVGFVLVVTGGSVGVGAWGVCYRSFRSVEMGVGSFCKHDCWKRGGVFY